MRIVLIWVGMGCGFPIRWLVKTSIAWIWTSCLVDPYNVTPSTDQKH